MRITCVGGGPGGLYAALLLKQADPRHEVVVHERNAPGDTFGFGVVFSAAALGELAAADRVSHDRIRAAAARWDPVEVRAGGARIRALGNGFAAISRAVLLRVLRERAGEVGVDLRFGDPVPDGGAHLDADLVIAADGVHSAVRTHHAEVFRPRVEREGGRYIWLGTTKVLDAFTFVFRRNAHGWFQVHAYPYAEDRSTFIVETDAATWRAAGFDARPAFAPGESDTESIAYCAELFAEDLEGHELLPNGSRWLDWSTVRCRTWRSGNVVLVGDAAHTAHFSIGSGTRLAMGDAVALAEAIAAEPSLDEALARYEGERFAVVERTQAAAAESLGWFARYHRYAGLAPPAFAYSLLSRSGRVQYDGLRRRDPALLASLERWYAEDAGAPPAVVAPPPVLTPLRLGRATVPNRVVLTTPPGLAADAAGAVPGLPGAELGAAVARLAGGGTGLVLVDRVAIAPGGRVTPEDPGLWDPAHATAWRAVLDAARAAGPALVGVRIGHAGARGATRPRREGTDVPLRDGWPLVAASPLPYTRRSAVPAALDAAGRAAVRDGFARSARLAAEAGFDLLEVDAGHGSLLAGFVSPLTNRRDDDCGGDLDGRLRFPLEVVAAVRDAWPADRPLAVRLTAADLEPGGLAPDEAVEAARRLAAAGADLLEVVSGQTTPRGHPSYDGAYDLGWSDLVRNGAGVPTLVSGGIGDLGEASGALLAGRADLCGLGPLPPDPAWLATWRTAEGRT